MSWRTVGVLLAVALVLLAVASVLPGPDVVAVEPPRGLDRTAQQACTDLHSLLPTDVDGRERRETSPISEQTAAWGSPAVALRCGVVRPAGLTSTSEVVEVDGVGWFLTERPREYVFTTVGRMPYVEVWVPGSTPRDRAAAPLVDLALAISETIPRD
ncbi:MAG: DUF3515 domain-containing protein [Actinomycetes bacterium]